MKKKENSRASLKLWIKIRFTEGTSNKTTKKNQKVIITFSFEEGTPTLIKWLKPNKLPEKTKEERLLEEFLIAKNPGSIKAQRDC